MKRKRKLVLTKELSYLTSVIKNETHMKDLHICGAGNLQESRTLLSLRGIS